MSLVKLPDFAHRREIRRAGGLTGYELAAVIGVSPASIYAWEIDREPCGLNRAAYAVALESLALPNHD